jgi:hypothetical protein
VASFVERSTAAEDVILIVGCDWSPEIPYYSHRRALMIPDWEAVSMPVLANRLQVIENNRIGAVVVGERWRSRSDPASLQSIVELVHLASDPSYSDERFAVYTRRIVETQALRLRTFQTADSLPINP